MKSKASYFSVSTSLIKENLRRFWAIPVISFLVYFLSGVFPILMSYDEINRMASYIEMSLQNLQPFYMGAHLLIPVLTAVILFRYLQSVSSVAVMHSLPFTRPRLFNSSFLSGMILILAPILLNGIILLLLAKPTYQQWGYGADLTVEAVDVFTRLGVINWIFTSMIIVLVLFSISVFAGIVTGNNLVHLLLSFFFIFLMSILYAVFNLYFDHYLYGFSLSGDWLEIGLNISPYTGILENQGHFDFPAVVFYKGTFLVMFIVSAVLYYRRKLERATDALTFDFLKPILCYIITLLGMTLLGFYFQVLGDESELYMYTGFAAGTIIFFIIGQMIVTKTTRIFNKEGLKSFLIYALIAILFLIGLNVDITGYERRVPDDAKIETAVLSNNFNNSISYYQPMAEEHNRFKNPENLKAITEFHRSILENRDRFLSSEDNGYYGSIDLSYDLGGLFDLSRTYMIDYEFYRDSQAMATIFESPEYKAINSLYNLGADQSTSILIYQDGYQNTVPEIKNQGDVDELISCLEEDFRAMTFAQFSSLRHTYASAELYYTYTEDDVIGGRDQTGTISLQIPLTSTRTIEWLEDHGYDFAVKADQIQSITIYPSQQSDVAIPMEKYSSVYDTEKYGYNGMEPIMTITDAEQIQKVLDRWDIQPIHSVESYSIEIQLQPSTAEEMTSKEMVPADYRIYGYLNEGLDFLK